MGEPLPQGDEKVQIVQSMFDRIAPRYEFVNRCLTLGLDARWRRVSLRKMDLASNSLVLDLACGTGDFCRLLASHDHQPIGVDLSLGMLEAVKFSPESETPLVQADVLKLPFADASVDGVTCGFALRNFVELPGFFKEVARVVRPKGRICFLDASTPTSRVLKFGHGIYFGKVVPIIGGLLSGDRAAYTYLPKSLGYMPPAKDVFSQIHSAGFDKIEKTIFSGGAAYALTASRIVNPVP